MSDQDSVLIVEDNDFIRMQIASYLKGDGYGVQEAPSGAEAMTIMSKNPEISAIVADLRMEPVGGFEFIKSLRIQNIDTPVILVTGDQTPDILEQAGKLSVAAVLMKPVEKTRLLGTVSRAIKGHKRG